jgi:hypothetical protein
LDDVSDAVVFRTGRVDTTFTAMYRVSEYTYDIDYLRNHDSADMKGSAAFLTSTNDNEFFQLRAAPVAEYCVEHFDAPKADAEAAGARVNGFAPYVSCNGPEADPRSHPSDPMCICDVYADR